MATEINIDHKKAYDASKNKQQWKAHSAGERYVLYGGGWGGGKTAWGINEGYRLSMKYPGNVGFMGCRDGTDFKRNAYNQVLKFIEPELYKTYKYRDRSGKIIKVEGYHNQSDQVFKLINGSKLYYGGLGNEAEAIKKISNMPELGWFFIDQAEEISENQFLLLCGRLRLNLPGIIYKGLLTANPDPGWLRARFIDRKNPDHIFIPALPEDNPFLPPDYVEKLREQYPEELVNRMLKGIWDIPGLNYLIPYSLIREATNRIMPPSGVKVAGVDIARYGDDKSVFIVRQGNKVQDIVWWHHQDTVFSAGKVADLIREHKPLVTNIDSIGVGVGVFDPLRAEGYNVREINVAEKSSKPEVYANKRAEYYSKLAKRFETGEIDIPDNAHLASELAGIKYKYQRGALLIESKEIMRRQGLKSPDFADALMLSFIPGTPVREASIYRAGVRIA